MFYICDMECLFDFPKLVKLDPCAVASLLEVLQGINFGCKVCISIHVEMIIKFDSAPEPIKKSISRTRSGD